MLSTIRRVYGVPGTSNTGASTLGSWVNRPYISTAHHVSAQALCTGSRFYYDTDYSKLIKTLLVPPEAELPALTTSRACESSCRTSSIVFRTLLLHSRCANLQTVSSGLHFDSNTQCKNVRMKISSQSYDLIMEERFATGTHSYVFKSLVRKMSAT